MSVRETVILELSRTIAAPPQAVWKALTTPALMRHWMLVPAHVLPDIPLTPGSRIEWRDDDGQAYLAGTVSDCLPERRLTVDLWDRSWPRHAPRGEVTWAFTLTPVSGGTRVDYRLGDLAIDPEAEGWRKAYAEADELARLARVLEVAAP